LAHRFASKRLNARRAAKSHREAFEDCVFSVWLGGRTVIDMAANLNWAVLNGRFVQQQRIIQDLIGPATQSVPHETEFGPSAPNALSRMP